MSFVVERGFGALIERGVREPKGCHQAELRWLLPGRGSGAETGPDLRRSARGAAVLCLRAGLGVLCILADRRAG